MFPVNTFSFPVAVSLGEKKKPTYHACLKWFWLVSKMLWIMDHKALHSALNLPYLNGSSFCKALSARLYTVPQQCFISKNKLCLYLQCMVKHLLSMESREEISFCKLFRHSYLLLPFMCNVLSKTNVSEVHLFVLQQDCATLWQDFKFKCHTLQVVLQLLFIFRLLK